MDKPQQALGRSLALPELFCSKIVDKSLVDYSVYTKEYSLPDKQKKWVIPTFFVCLYLVIYF